MKRNSWRQAERDLYLAQRTMGDIDAAKRGRLGKRLIKRAITRNLLRALWRK